MPLDIVDHEFTYTQNAPQRTHRNRQHNIIWFNPPFSKSVNTNIGWEFLSLIDKHFPLQHKLHKIFNRNTLKVSYSCMNNVKSIITKHNTHIIRNSQSQNTETDNCNCNNKNTCPLPKQCMTNNIIYTVTTNNTKHYIGGSIIGGTHLRKPHCFSNFNRKPHTHFSFKRNRIQTEAYVVTYFAT